MSAFFQHRSHIYSALPSSRGATTPLRHYSSQKAVQNKQANLLFYRSLETTGNAGHIQGRQRPLLQRDGLPQASIDETSHKNAPKHTSWLFTLRYHLDMVPECFKQAPDIIAECIVGIECWFVIKLARKIRPFRKKGEFSALGFALGARIVRTDM